MKRFITVKEIEPIADVIFEDGKPDVLYFKGYRVKYNVSYIDNILEKPVIDYDQTKTIPLEEICYQDYEGSKTDLELYLEKRIRELEPLAQIKYVEGKA
ncbi:hypothetical protein [Bacillus subtilis]|uniref:hypothetical protein n=1 Tax=Bacillus subtilis TaxID=1423 RepID=UPI00034C84B1|nr:hypothetical protein [Bacillus subtilis]